MRVAVFDAGDTGRGITAFAGTLVDGQVAGQPLDVSRAVAEPLDYAGGQHPLDLDGLLDDVAGEGRRDKAGPGLTIGHVHLHVGGLERGVGFYRDVLGFELMTFMPGAAAFVAAGGYHHLGFNIWRGEGVHEYSRVERQDRERRKRRRCAEDREPIAGSSRIHRRFIANSSAWSKLPVTQESRSREVEPIPDANHVTNP